MLNLACADTIKGGFALGRLVNLIGDSSSGKTLLALTMIAEAAHSKQMDNYRLVFDDAEAALSFDMSKMFGKKTAKRIEKPPRGHSNKVEDFEKNFLDLIAGDKPFVYVLDSFDSITTDEEIRRAEERRTSEKEQSGSYGMRKAKFGSEFFRLINSALERTDSLLVIISQTRENISPMSFVEKTRAGGKALKFYSSHEIWLAASKAIKSKDRKIGNMVKAKVSKNKITGKERIIEFPVYYSYGVDDIGSCIDFLIAEKQWKQTKAKITAPDFDFEGTRVKLLTHIEEEDLQDDVRELVQDLWTEIEDSIKVKRKPRYE
jgi:recombination protein RecA